MKTIAVIFALCAASLAQAQGPLGTNPLMVAGTNCGFYAGVTYMDMNRMPHHCKVSIQVTRPTLGEPCGDRANKFQDNSKIGTNACAVFAGKCHNSDKDPSSRICLGHAGQRASDAEVEAMLRRCLAYATGQPPNYKWLITCGAGEAPDYARFASNIRK